jgi:hypothetical protein
MKRITITRVAPVLAFLASVVMTGALTGCLGATSSTEGTDESSIVSNRAHKAANAEDNAAYNGGPAQTLELKTRADDQGQGPHPEPWLDLEGPHPEPWQSKNITSAPDPDPNANNGNNKP